jgi:hypothetical protein
MKTSTFICPFDLATRQTTYPVDAQGQPIPLAAAWHVTPESAEGTIVCKIKAEDAVIDAMKLDATYQWLEDFEDATVTI